MKKLLTLAAVAAIGLSATPAFAGVSLNGSKINGIGLNGIGLNGIGLNGIGLNGIGLNGVSLNGSKINGASVSGHGRTTETSDGGVAPVVKTIRLGSGAVVTVR